MDLDGDGRTDLISGSFPGEIYFFRRQSDGSFAAGRPLKDRRGKSLDVGSASAAFAVDWNGDGALDLLVGNVLGEVYFVPNEGRPGELAFGSPRRVEAGGQPLKVSSGDAGPAVGDWDGDGKLDLVVGAEDGSVVWYRNIGTSRAPKLEAARRLIGPSPLGRGWDDKRKPGDWGLRVKPCLVDWDGDGRLDILLGDCCGGYQGKPSQTEQEKREERQANDHLPELRRKWSATFAAYRKLEEAAADETAAGRQERLRRRDELRLEMTRYKEEMVAVQSIQERYQPGSQSHGFVWLFQRKPQAR